MTEFPIHCVGTLHPVATKSENTPFHYHASCVVCKGPNIGLYEPTPDVILTLILMSGNTTHRLFDTYLLVNGAGVLYMCNLSDRDWGGDLVYSIPGWVIFPGGKRARQLAEEPFQG